MLLLPLLLLGHASCCTGVCAVSKGAFAVITERDAPPKEDSWADDPEDINTLASTLATPPPGGRVWHGGEDVEAGEGAPPPALPFDNPLGLLEGMWL